MATHGRPRILLEQLPLEEPQPFELDYHCLRYPGEIIRSENWDPAWGELLTGDRYFRIVFLRQHSTASPPLSATRASLYACRATKNTSSGTGYWMILLPSGGLRPCTWRRVIRSRT
jgi:hypothetical protein